MRVTENKSVDGEKESEEVCYYGHLLGTEEMKGGENGVRCDRTV